MIVCEHSSLLTHVNGWVPIAVKWSGKTVFIQFFWKSDTDIGKNAYICKRNRQ